MTEHPMNATGTGASNGIERGATSAVLFAALAGAGPIVIDYGSYGWIVGLPVSILLFATSLILGGFACVRQRRLMVTAFVAPLFVGYLLVRDSFREPVFWRVEHGGFLGVPAGTAGVLCAAALIPTATAILLVILGKGRLGRTNPWYVCAGSGTGLTFLLDVYGYEAEEHAGLRRAFVVCSFWLVWSCSAFAYFALRDMHRRRVGGPARRLVGTVGMVTGTFTICSAVGVASGMLTDSLLDIGHIEVLSRRLERVWLVALYVLIGGIVATASLRALVFQEVEGAP